MVTKVSKTAAYILELLLESLVIPFKMGVFDAQLVQSLLGVFKSQFLDRSDPLGPHRIEHDGI